MEALEQRVVQLAGDPRPLPDARLERHVELVLQLPDTQLVTCPQQRQKNSRAHGAEPRRVPPWRENLQLQGRSLFIPYAAVVRALNAQRIASGRQSCKSRYSAIGAHPVPGIVERLEHVPILVPLRIHVAQSREFEGEQVLVVRQRQGRRRRDGLCEDGARARRHRHVPQRELREDHRRDVWVLDDLLRPERREPALAAEEHLTAPGLGGGRVALKGASARPSPS
jgi:hypothetical protein